MGYLADNPAMPEANTGDFTFSATGVTSYSKEIDFSRFSMSEVLIQTKGVFTNKSGAVITFTLQYYDLPTATWYDHTASFSTIVGSGAATQANSLDIGTAFGNKVRMRAVSSGTFGASESVVITIGALGKHK